MLALQSWPWVGEEIFWHSKQILDLREEKRLRLRKLILFNPTVNQLQFCLYSWITANTQMKNEMHTIIRTWKTDYSMPHSLYYTHFIFKLQRHSDKLKQLKLQKKKDQSSKWRWDRTNSLWGCCRRSSHPNKLYHPEPWFNPSFLVTGNFKTKY